MGFLEAWLALGLSTLAFVDVLKFRRTLLGAPLVQAQYSSDDCVSLTKQPPSINQAIVEGSIQVLESKNFSINSHATITGDILVPGSPSIILNGQGGEFDGVVIGGGQFL